MCARMICFESNLMKYDIFISFIRHIWQYMCNIGHTTFFKHKNTIFLRKEKIATFLNDFKQKNIKTSTYTHIHIYL